MERGKQSLGSVIVMVTEIGVEDPLPPAMEIEGQGVNHLTLMMNVISVEIGDIMHMTAEEVVVEGKSYSRTSNLHTYTSV